ncbi:MAG TPA: S8 family serine peptidase [Clostridia bacterium]|nr:S8 family serine peptidase [Clostridia bacterium]
MKHPVHSKYSVMVLVLTIFAFSLLGSPALAVDALTDVKGHWAGEDIALLQARGIVGGYPDGSFRPERGVTRAEFACLLIAALGMEDSAWALEKGSQLFRDVPLNHWANGYIQLAWELGVVSGYKDGNFRPEQVIRRDEISSMLVRALRYIGTGQEERQYMDWENVPTWARDSIRLATLWGLVNGYEDGTFRAGEPVTRAEAAVFINRLMAQRGSSFDFYGKLTSLSSQELVMEIGGASHRMPLEEKAPIFAEGKPLDWSIAGRSMPREGMVVLNKEGKVVFVKLLSQAPVENIFLAWQPTPGEKAEAAPTRNFGLLDYRLEEEPELPRGERKEPWRSLEITREELGATSLQEETRADGSGEIIAIIDSGVDPGHPDLQETTSGEGKILDWVNLTSEGRVELAGSIQAGTSRLNHQGVTYNLGRVASRSGILKYGFLREEEQKVDFNLDGKEDTSFLVVATDSRVKGVYDTVIIDISGDRSLEGVEALQVFGATRQVGSFPGPYDNKFNFVVTEIAAGGGFVVLGYDQTGHGTQVAGVASASGKIKGVAPGSQLLVVKVLDAQGETEWDRLEKGIRYAANHGATVINLSLGYYQDESAGNNTLTRLVEDLSKKGIVFTIAAGNRGPGVGTVSTPGNAKSAISVGAYITPRMWENDYGYEVASPSLWYFSSAGPRQDGLLVPTVVAPGSAVSTWPLATGDGYKLGEGTSIAAPHVAGVAALLLESAGRQGLSVDPEMIKRAITLGARKFPGFSAAEVGYGILDGGEAWRHLRRLEKQVSLRGYTYNRRLGFGEGFYSREILPGQVPFRIANQSSDNQVLFWTSSAEWLKPWFQMTALPRDTWRELPVDYLLPREPGIYTGFLRGDSLGTYGLDVDLMTTIIKPYTLDRDNGFRQEFAENLPAGQYRRYFLKVPSGTAVLQALLSVPGESGSAYRGRVRMHLIRPDGVQKEMTDWAGLAPEGMPGREWANLTVENPEPGTWEVVVYSSAALSTYGRDDSQYRLRVQLAGVEEKPPVQTGSRYLLGALPKKLVPGVPNYLTVSVRDKDNLKPIEGMLTINEQLYQIKNGRVTLAVRPEAEEMVLEIGL